MDNKGYYDDLGNWITGYYNEDNIWVEGYFTPEGDWIEFKAEDNSREDGLFDEDFYEESYIEDQSNITENMKPPRSPWPKIITSLAILTIAGVGYITFQTTTNKSNISSMVEFKNTNKIQQTKEDTTYYHDLEKGKAEVSEMEYLVSSEGNKVSLYYITLSPNLNKEQIREIVTEKKLKSLPNFKDSSKIIVYLTDSRNYHTLPTLGKAELSQEGFEIDIKEKNWGNRPTEEEASIYKRYLDIRKSKIQKNNYYTPQSIIEETSKKLDRDIKEVKSAIDKVEMWVNDDNSNS